MNDQASIAVSTDLGHVIQKTSEAVMLLSKDMSYMKADIGETKNSVANLVTHVQTQNGRIGKGEGRANGIVMSAGVVVILGGIIIGMASYVYTSNASSVQQQLLQIQKEITLLQAK